MSKKQTITYNGSLVYDDLGNYQLIYPTGSTNISKILNKIYYADKNYIELKIMNGCKTIFNEKGNLYIKPDDYGVYCYHIDGECLESVLFFNTDKDLDIEIYAEALDTQGDVKYDAEQQVKK